MSRLARFRRLIRDPAALGPTVRASLQRGARKKEDVLTRAQTGVLARLFPLRVHHVSGPESVDARADEAVVVCLVRDGAEYLDGFLDHYRALGVRRVVFLDNGSTDGTVERLSAEPDVTVLRTDAPYKKIKVIAKRYLIERFGDGCWALCVDIDELFDYPRREVVPLRDFLQYLNGRGYSAAVAYMLDMFPKGPLVASGDWKSGHRFYSLDSLVRRPYYSKFKPSNEPACPDRIGFCTGGVRLAKFGFRPNLTKHPLQFPGRGVRHMTSHHVAGARVADVSAVLLHYKYAAGFLDYAERLVAEESFHDGSAEYSGYLDRLNEDPSFSLYTKSSRELVHVDQLMGEGFLIESEAFAAYARTTE